MKKATYTNLDGTKRIVEYDENFPCLMCGLPVVEASMGGTAICPWCDCGNNRDGTPWSDQDHAARMKHYRKAIAEHRLAGDAT